MNLGIDQGMKELKFNLPAQGCLGARTIDACQWRLRTFVERDAYAVYDYRGCYALPPQNEITTDHVAVTNSAMRARSSRKAWAHFIGQPLPELDRISFECDLIAADEGEFANALAALLMLAERITSVKGLKEMAVSKVLYLLRPNFVAIADSYVRDALGVYRSNDATQNLLRVMEAVRLWGSSHRNALDRLANDASTIQTVHAPSGPDKGKEIPVHLSRVRIVDTLLWTEMAIHGPTPHAAWSRWYADQVSSAAKC